MINIAFEAYFFCRWANITFYHYIFEYRVTYLT